VLAGLVAVGSVGAAGGTALLLQPTARRQPGTPLKVLDERAFSVLVAVADRICPGAAGLPPASELGVAEKVDALLDRAHPGIARDVSSILALLENPLAGLFLDGRPRPFTSCTIEEQDHILERWRTSGIFVRRTAFRALHGLCSGAYWSDPRTYSFTGYPGPSFAAAPG
jgi:hypothetical protein